MALVMLDMEFYRRNVAFKFGVTHWPQLRIRTYMRKLGLKLSNCSKAILS
jgi:hypothetical protein